MPGSFLYPVMCCTQRHRIYQCHAVLLQPQTFYCGQSWVPPIVSSVSSYFPAPCCCLLFQKPSCPFPSFSSLPLWVFYYLLGQWIKEPRSDLCNKYCLKKLPNIVMNKPRASAYFTPACSFAQCFTVFKTKVPSDSVISCTSYWGTPFSQETLFKCRL